MQLFLGKLIIKKGPGRNFGVQMRYIHAGLHTEDNIIAELKFITNFFKTNILLHCYSTLHQL